MRPHRFADYQFENPPLLTLLADRIFAPIWSPLRTGKLLAMAKIGKGSRVLDFGCGGGVVSRAIARKIGPEGHLLCLDVSAFWLSICKKRLRRFANADFFHGDVRELPTSGAPFDTILIHRVLQFILPDQRASVVARLSGALRSGGRLLICEKTGARSGLEAHNIRALADEAGLTEDMSSREGARMALRFVRS